MLLCGVSVYLVRKEIGNPLGSFIYSENLFSSALALWLTVVEDQINLHVVDLSNILLKIHYLKQFNAEYKYEVYSECKYRFGEKYGIHIPNF